MSGLVRFLHASDFHLEAPPHGLAEIPPHLREALLEAPYVAARRVFDAAASEHVDFVVLAGDVLDVPLAGPRGLAFLVSQFERLEAEGIAVYWAAGRVDGPQQWPAAVKLPPNVQLFPTYKTEEISHFRGEKALASLTGRGFAGTLAIQPADFGGNRGDLPTIAVTFGQAEVERLAARSVDYWALGGEHQRQSHSVRKLAGQDDAEWHAANLVHYPGTPQGRGLDEPGPHGCTLVHISDEHTIRTQFIATDALRWHDETMSIDETQSRSDAKRRIAERMQRLVAEAGQRPILVRFRLSGGAHLGSLHERRQWCGDLCDWLRSEFGRGEQGAWSLAVELDAGPLPRAWEAEDSMLGDFLRVLRQQEDAAEPLELSSYLPPRLDRELTQALGDWASGTGRTRLLREAAAAGAQLLGAEHRSAG